MDSVVDKEQRLGEGRSEVEDRNFDLEDLMDDEEVALNLPSEGCRGAGPTGGENPTSAGGHRFGGHGDSADGMVSDGASEWGSTKLEPSGTANPGD